MKRARLAATLALLALCASCAKAPLRFTIQYMRSPLVYENDEVCLGGKPVGRVDQVRGKDVEVVIDREYADEMKANSVFLARSRSFLGGESKIEVIPPEGDFPPIRYGETVPAREGSDLVSSLLNAAGALFNKLQTMAGDLRQASQKPEVRRFAREAVEFAKAAARKSGRELARFKEERLPELERDFDRALEALDEAGDSKAAEKLRAFWKEIREKVGDRTD